tara:strand:- start:6085 stop:6237 length:153 start_codon:yes stop_codon:yes gene_type:complete
MAIPDSGYDRESEEIHSLIIEVDAVDHRAAEKISRTEVFLNMEWSSEMWE